MDCLADLKHQESIADFNRASRSVELRSPSLFWCDFGDFVYDLRFLWSKAEFRASLGCAGMAGLRKSFLRGL